MATRQRSAPKGARVKRTYQQWRVEPTPTILDVLNNPDHPDHPKLLKELGLDKGWPPGLAPLSADDKLRASDALRKGQPIRMGGTVTRYPDPGGNPTLGVQADDVAVRYGGEPTRNPTGVSGLSIAPGANAVIADTGQLAAGTYYVEIQLATSASPAAGKHLQVEHRNAANAATVNVIGGCPGGVVTPLTVERLVVALNERVRVITGAVAFAATEGAIASIRVYKLDV